MCGFLTFRDVSGKDGSLCKGCVGFGPRCWDERPGAATGGDLGAGLEGESTPQCIFIRVLQAADQRRYLLAGSGSLALDGHLDQLDCLRSVCVPYFPDWVFVHAMSSCHNASWLLPSRLHG